ANLPAIAGRLQAAGLPPETPVAVVAQGTRPDQRTVEGTLDNIAARVAAADLASPATIVIGEVVSLRDHLAWFPEQQQTPMEALVP
ncbi:MAG TPA: uroporphyrin-III C-methyltransferase, partial [Chloroflexota bacterium]